MNTLTLNGTKQWIKTSNHPIAKFLFVTIKSLLNFDIPLPKFFLKLLYHCHCFFRTLFASLARVFIWTPLLKGRLDGVGKRLYLYGGLPFISGATQIHIGNDCRISGHTTISGRVVSDPAPVLMVGDNVDIGWLTTIAVGSRIEIGNNVRIAGRAFFAGYPGHPIDPIDRAKGLPDTDNQVGDIILEDDVWLATGVSVMAGVHIGHGTIVAADSVVTHDLPSMVLAAGSPAKVIRSLSPSSKKFKDDL
ncbi:acetyltransferase [Gammaproteobacteria bacterium 45_16_T64]|nr:acetyltransferase [Gammaproteobacteria bacterium 45_16_T64]